MPVSSTCCTWFFIRSPRNQAQCIARDENLDCKLGIRQFVAWSPLELLHCCSIQAWVQGIKQAHLLIAETITIQNFEIAENVFLGGRSWDDRLHKKYVDCIADVRGSQHCYGQQLSMRIAIDTQQQSLTEVMQNKCILPAHFAEPIAKLRELLMFYVRWLH